MSSKLLINQANQNIDEFGNALNHPDEYYKNDDSMNTLLSLNNAHEMRKQGIIDPTQVNETAVLLSNIPNTNTQQLANQFDYMNRKSLVNDTDIIPLSEQEFYGGNTPNNTPLNNNLNSGKTQLNNLNSDLNSGNLQLNNSNRLNTLNTENKSLSQFDSYNPHPDNKLYTTDQLEQYQGGNLITQKDVDPNELRANLEAKNLGLSVEPYEVKMVDKKGNVLKKTYSPYFYYKQTFDPKNNVMVNKLTKGIRESDWVIDKAAPIQNNKKRNLNEANVYNAQAVVPFSTADELNKKINDRLRLNNIAEPNEVSTYIRKINENNRKMADFILPEEKVKLEKENEELKNKIETISGKTYNHIKEIADDETKNYYNSFVKSPVLNKEDTEIRPTGQKIKISGKSGKFDRRYELNTGVDKDDNMYVEVPVLKDNQIERIWIPKKKYDEDRDKKNVMFNNYYKNGYIYKVGTSKEQRAVPVKETNITTFKIDSGVEDKQNKINQFILDRDKEGLEDYLINNDFSQDEIEEINNAYKLKTPTTFLTSKEKNKILEKRLDLATSNANYIKPYLNKENNITVGVEKDGKNYSQNLKFKINANGNGIFYSVYDPNSKTYKEIGKVETVNSDDDVKNKLLNLLNQKSKNLKFKDIKKDVQFTKLR